MTRKDYVLLAQALNDAYPEYREPDMLQQWGVTVQRIADALADDNARFNSQRFIDACKAGH